MDLPVNHFKRALAAGKPQIGLWNSLSSYLVTEIVAGAGYDWVLIDTSTRRSASRTYINNCKP